MSETLKPSDALFDYYNKRAREYEQIYAKPERQDALGKLKTHLQKILSGHDVLEIACGTGYWTEVIASTTRSVLATDISEEMLSIARQKNYPSNNVSFALNDAYELDKISGNFTACFAAFWWSHVPKNKITHFLSQLHSILRKNSLIIFIDNQFVEGSSTPISRTDADGNTYQNRTLQNGEQHEILKNFPSEQELAQTFCDQENFHYHDFIYFWSADYHVKLHE